MASKFAKHGAEPRMADWCPIGGVPLVFCIFSLILPFLLYVWCSWDPLCFGPISPNIQSEPTIYNNEAIRIVLVGKTGAGKSSTGNTILGEGKFEAKFSFKSFTKQCAKAFGEVDGQTVAVIDTPGVFDTCEDEDKTKRDIAQSICYASPGPHIFLIVIKLGRFTEEEKKTVQKIQQIFGEEADKYSMVLFTHGDQLEGALIEEFLKEDKDLQELVSRCNGQYHVFNNKLKDRSQVRELLNKIRKITEKNGGRHYTTEMFQKTEKAIEEEKQRILKEKEKQRLKEQEKLEKEIEKKYEEEIRKMNADREKQEQQLREARERELEKQEKQLKEARERELEKEKQLGEARERELEKEKQLNDARNRELEKEKQLKEALERELEKERQLRETRERELEEERIKLKEKQEREARQEAENSDGILNLIKGFIEVAVEVLVKMVVSMITESNKN